MPRIHLLGKYLEGSQFPKYPSHLNLQQSNIKIHSLANMTRTQDMAPGYFVLWALCS